MSIFYVVPSRPFLGKCFAGYLRTLFPGLEWSGSAWPELAETLHAPIRARADVYVVHQEEVPEGEDLRAALINGFGAEAGDEVVEVRAGSRVGEFITRRWRLDSAHQA